MLAEHKTTFIVAELTLDNEGIAVTYIETSSVYLQVLIVKDMGRQDILTLFRKCHCTDVSELQTD
jgi:hypothetical protein